MKKCRFCNHYSFNSEIETEIKMMYGKGIKFTSLCNKMKKDVNGNSLCENFEPNYNFRKYKFSQEIDYNHEPKCVIEYAWGKAADGIRIFDTIEEAKSHYSKLYKIAESKFLTIQNELNKLMKSYDFTIDYMVKGDTYGIELDYQYISVRVENYNFDFIY